MKNNIFFIIDYIETKFYSILEVINYFLNRNSYDPSTFVHPANYKLVKIIKKSYGPFARLIGIFTDNSNEQYLIKILRRRYLNGSAKAFLTDATVLKIISNLDNTSKNRRSNHVSLLQTTDYMVLIRRYIIGKDVSQSSNKVILNAYYAATQYLAKAWEFSNSDLSIALIKDSPLWQIAMFPIVLVKCILREPSQTTKLLQLTYHYCANMNFADILTPEYELSHKDLTPENILQSNSGYQLIDFENCSISEAHTDLSFFLLYYRKYLGSNTILQHIVSNLPTRTSKRVFIRLSIYNILHFLSYEEKSFPYYKEGLICLSILTNTIIPEVKAENESLAEKVYFNVLSICSHLYSYNQPSCRDVILCYHDISENNWRFSTSPKEFYKQLLSLKRDYDIVSMSKLLNHDKTSKPKAVITFDDGYKSIYTNAFPIMEKLGLTATIFILGTPKKRNINTLDNKLPMMNYKQINKLASNGWSIGYHTATHPRLNSLDHETLRHEILETKNAIEKDLGMNIYYFAYPMGIYNQEILDIIKLSMYSHAFTVDGGSAKTNSNFLINRLPIEGKININQFKSLLSTFGLSFSQLFMSILKVKQAFIELFSKKH
jgi:peptidoglycan/xylan/chitin deacetylase (PgdA/CDA1 family)